MVEGEPNQSTDSYVSNRAASRHGLKRRSCSALDVKKKGEMR